MRRVPARRALVISREGWVVRTASSEDHRGIPVDPREEDVLSEGDTAGAQLRATRRVFIRGLELIGSVGVYEHEKRYEQRVVVSLDLTVRDDYDGRSDRLEHVYDYDHAINAVKATVASAHFNLVETLAERIADACLIDPRVLAVRVQIEKPDVLASCRAVGIEIRRSRQRG
jgi:dihydroneopterin aldolase